MLAGGQLLAERYRLASRIAVGGMGEVWQANDIRLDREVAVKVLKTELTGDAEFLHRFRTEARMTASLNHPGIAGVHDYGETVDPGGSTEDGDVQHIAYLVMELVEGEPLAGILAREGRISADRTLDVLEQAGHALQAAHEQGLVHRDVKPGNILVTPSGTVKLTDFGIAKAAHATPVTRSGMVMGTAHYIAPEQALGHDAEPASDVYSLAVCGYECLAGRRPFLSENAVTVAMMHIRDAPPPLPPDVPPGTRALIEATLVKDPRARYASGGEFANAVAAVRAGYPLPAPAGLAAQRAAATRAIPPATAQWHAPGPATSAGPIAQPHRRINPAAWILVGLLLIAVIVAALLVLPKLFSRDSSTNQTPTKPATETSAPNRPPSSGKPSDENPSEEHPTQHEQPPSSARLPSMLPPNTGKPSKPDGQDESPNQQGGGNADGEHKRAQRDGLQAHGDGYQARNQPQGMMSQSVTDWNGTQR